MKALRLLSVHQLRYQLQRECRRFLSSSFRPDPELVEASRAPPDFDADSAIVYNNVITQGESDLFASDLQRLLKRRRYERGHWDAVIKNYKETELFDETLLSDMSREVMDRIRSILLANHFHSSQHVTWLPCHAIDLHAEGELNAHVDSVRFSGHLVAGLSLLSASIMRFCPVKGDKSSVGDSDQADQYVDLLLPPRSLYVMSGPSRYEYTHELLPSASLFSGRPIERGHRLSVIFRDSKD